MWHVLLKMCFWGSWVLYGAGITAVKIGGELCATFFKDFVILLFDIFIKVLITWHLRRCQQLPLCERLVSDPWGPTNPRAVIFSWKSSSSSPSYINVSVIWFPTGWTVVQKHIFHGPSLPCLKKTKQIKGWQGRWCCWWWCKMPKKWHRPMV